MEWKPEARSQKTILKTELFHGVKLRRSKDRDIREDLTVIEHFGSIVREARQRLNLSQEDLGRKISEKVSVIRKIESEKIMPNERLARKLERALGVKLIVPLVEPEPLAYSSQRSRGLTLGEIAHLKDLRRRHSRDEGNNS